MLQGTRTLISPLQVYHILLTTYGPQGWWPAETPFEVMVGAILTQSTNWKNVEKAIANLKATDMMDVEHIATSNPEQLAEIIRPAGFYRQKAQRLQQLCLFYLKHGREQQLRRWPASSLRQQMLRVHGIGPETADSILLYALDKPVFVVDAYTRRIFSRLGSLPENADYAETQAFFHARLPNSIRIFQELHALIVEHAKRHCRVKPLCTGCPLAHACQFAETAESACDTKAAAQGLAYVERTTA